MGSGVGGGGRGKHGRGAGDQRDRNRHFNKRGRGRDITPAPINLTQLASLFTNDASPDNVIPCTLRLGNTTNSFRCLIDNGCLQDNLADLTIKK